MTLADVVKNNVHFSAVGDRQTYRCGICQATGRDEPLLGKTAQDQAVAHFEKVAAHFRAVAFMVPEEARRGELFSWMKTEMARFSLNENAAYIGSEIAKTFYQSEIADRDNKINRLSAELATLKGKSNGA